MSGKRIQEPLILKTSETYYADNGQTFWRVYWSSDAITESPRMGAHMRALFERAKRENVPHEMLRHDTPYDPLFPFSVAWNDGDGMKARITFDDLRQRYIIEGVRL